MVSVPSTVMVAPAGTELIRIEIHTSAGMVTSVRPGIMVTAGFRVRPAFVTAGWAAGLSMAADAVPARIIQSSRRTARYLMAGISASDRIKLMSLLSYRILNREL
jgi:hypothetical protein